MAEGTKGQSVGGSILYDAKTDFGANGLQHVQSGTGAITLKARGGDLVMNKPVKSASGAITLNAAVGSIIDNLAGEDANITTDDLLSMTAASGIGGSGESDIDTDVSKLQAKLQATDSAGVSGGIVIEERDALSIVGDGISVESSSDGSIDIRIDAEDAILTIDASVKSMNGNISLMADDMDLTEASIVKIASSASIRISIEPSLEDSTLIPSPTMLKASRSSITIPPLTPAESVACNFACNLDTSVSMSDSPLPPMPLAAVMLKRSSVVMLASSPARLSIIDPTAAFSVIAPDADFTGLFITKSPPLALSVIAPVPL
jgi:hypothetical protein